MHMDTQIIGWSRQKAAPCILACGDSPIACSDAVLLLPQGMLEGGLTAAGMRGGQTPQVFTFELCSHNIAFTNDTALRRAKCIVRPARTPFQYTMPSNPLRCCTGSRWYMTACGEEFQPHLEGLAQAFMSTAGAVQTHQICD